MSDNVSHTQPTPVNTPTVGVVGLGVMGHAIATRLQHELGALGVSDLRPDAANDLVDAGATFYGTPPKPPHTATSSCCP